MVFLNFLFIFVLFSGDAYAQGLYRIEKIELICSPVVEKCQPIKAATGLQLFLIKGVSFLNEFPLSSFDILGCRHLLEQEQVAFFLS